MEPRREEPRQEEKVTAPASEKKPNRFRIVKLEERIAPGKGGNTNHDCTDVRCLPASNGCMGSIE
jgi:hypothetical protein